MKVSFSKLLFSLLMVVFCFIIINLNTGFIPLELTDFFTENTHSKIAEIRINRVMVMLLAGVSIPTSGFLMQEYFQNPLAGPDILGITSVASLFVALYIFFFNSLEIPEFLNNSLLTLSAMVGSFMMLFLLIFISRKMNSPSYLIIFGFLISALTGAIVALLEFYADNQSLKNYILWSFGANNRVTRNQIGILLVLISIGLFISFKTIKPLIGNSLGNSYAKSFGVDIHLLKILIIMASSILCASITAFLGPVLFIGIIVPHFCRMIYAPAYLWHQWVLNMTIGVLMMVGFSIVSEYSQIPLNVLSTLFGIPVIVLILTKKSKGPSY